MWKTDLIDCNNYTYKSTGLVDKMWKKHLPVENSDESYSFPLFPQDKISSTCGNVENFCLIIVFTYRYLND